jgi:hypothetical protein
VCVFVVVTFCTETDRLATSDTINDNAANNSTNIPLTQSADTIPSHR